MGIERIGTQMVATYVQDKLQNEVKTEQESEVIFDNNGDNNIGDTLQISNGTGSDVSEANQTSDSVTASETESSKTENNANNHYNMFDNKNYPWESAEKFAEVTAASDVATPVVSESAEAAETNQTCSGHPFWTEPDLNWHASAGYDTFHG